MNFANKIKINTTLKKKLHHLRKNNGNTQIGLSFSRAVKMWMFMEGTASIFDWPEG